MKRCLLFFVIIFMGLSLPLSAKQKLICHINKKPVQISYKTDAYNGKEVVFPVDKLNPRSGTCPDSITVEDTQSEKHTLPLSTSVTSDGKYCYYGTDNDLMCMFTYYLSK